MAATAVKELKKILNIGESCFFSLFVGIQEQKYFKKH